MTDNKFPLYPALVGGSLFELIKRLPSKRRDLARERLSFVICHLSYRPSFKRGRFLGRLRTTASEPFPLQNALGSFRSYAAAASSHRLSISTRA
jgi:hypothetical protein